MTNEEIAQAFHDAYERLAPSFGYETRKESAKPWGDVPDNNRRLMTAVCAEVRPLIEAPLREEIKRQHDAAVKFGAQTVRLTLEAAESADAFKDRSERLAKAEAERDRLRAALAVLTSSPPGMVPGWIVQLAVDVYRNEGDTTPQGHLTNVNVWRRP